LKASVDEAIGQSTMIAIRHAIDSRSGKTQGWV
jgi:hypothetical protein